MPMDETNPVEGRRKRSKEMRSLTLFQLLAQALPKVVTTYGVNYISQ